eukprot:641440-Prymnesium_polylepis.1
MLQPAGTPQRGDIVKLPAGRLSLKLYVRAPHFEPVMAMPVSAEPAAQSTCVTSDEERGA